MAEKFSSGAVNSLLGNAFLKGTSLGYNDNGASPDTITDSENRFKTAGFRVGDEITTANSTSASNDISGVTLTAVAAGTLSIATGNLGATEAFAAATYVTSNNGGDFKTIFANGVLEIYSGSQPSDADQDESGTKLVRITQSSGAFTPGSATNGLNFEKIISGYAYKDTDETWSGTAVADGTAGWFRFYANPYDTGADATAVRFDGSVGTSNADLNLSNLSIETGQTVTVDSFYVRIPTS